MLAQACKYERNVVTCVPAASAGNHYAIAVQLSCIGRRLQSERDYSKEAIMSRPYGRYEYDNRDSGQMYEYMEARIEALKRHIMHLEKENEVLRWKDGQGAHLDSLVLVASNYAS